MRVALLAAASAVGIFAVSGLAQSPAPAKPKFDVASVRPGCGSALASAGATGSRGSTEGLSPAGLSMCAPLITLVRTAYVQYSDGHFHFPSPASVSVEGGPAWVNSDRYQINAKAEGTPGQEMMRGPMLQALLEDRFKLKIRRETREVPIYELTVAKGGPKLAPYKEGSCTPWDFTKDATPPFAGGLMPCSFPIPGSKKNDPSLLALEVHGTSLDELSKMLLGMVADRPVIDKTGIAGRFDIHVEYADPHKPGVDDLGPSIFTAVEEQLGLKLEPAKGRGEFLVIDSVERPSEN